MQDIELKDLYKQVNAALDEQAKELDKIMWQKCSKCKNLLTKECVFCRRDEESEVFKGNGIYRMERVLYFDNFEVGDCIEEYKRKVNEFMRIGEKL